MFTPGVDYVYIPNSRVRGNQIRLRGYLEDATASLRFVNISNPSCFEAVTKALCIHYYLPCGVNGSLHVPQFLCPDTCRYLTDVVCTNIWPEAVSLLSTGIDPSLRNMGLDLPICNDTSMTVASLELSEDCCSTGGVMIPQEPIVSSPPATTNTLITPLVTPFSASTLTIIGSAVGGGVALLVAMTTSCLLLMFLCWRRRKARREKVDMAIRYMYKYCVVTWCTYTIMCTFIIIYSFLHSVLIKVIGLMVR